MSCDRQMNPRVAHRSVHLSRDLGALFRAPGLAMLSFLTPGLLCGAAMAESAKNFTPLPLSQSTNEVKVRLGERLFSDPRLSHESRDSCASCHPLDRGAMDGQSRAESAYGAAPLRNTPTVFNVGFNFFFNWDGSTTTLEAHAEKTLLNPKVMNTTWPELLTGLRADPEYARAFRQAYPDGLNRANLLDALASFEGSLATPNSRFDRYLRGEKDALDAAEEQGYRLFESLGCVACHQGINIGGNLFQKFGIFGKPEGTNEDSDPGRYAVTHDDRDRDVFRVPSLRNVAITDPYFHDGRAATLEKAVDTMAQRQLGRRLTSEERGLIIRFLNTLTGEYRGKPLSRVTH
jgi:cytochrome c peroxidase